MDADMAELKSSSRVDPAIFQQLQEKIDEEGTIRDVRKLCSYAECFAGCALTRHPGAQGHRSEVREARSATSFIGHASSLNFLTGRLTQSILSRMHNTPDESSETVSTASP
jgi:hypothetical protein